jgi:methionyl aminopeptidase
MLLVPGMVFTIEPMVNAGKADVVLNQDNGWTVNTRDGKDSAQWEVTVLITEDGYEVLAY